MGRTAAFGFGAVLPQSDITRLRRPIVNRRRFRGMSPVDILPARTTTMHRLSGEDGSRIPQTETHPKGGSVNPTRRLPRFNLRYASRVPENISPQTVMAALAEYVAFFPDGPNLSAAPLPIVVGVPFPAPGPMPTPYKGMLRTAAEQAFGRPVETRSRREGALNVVTLTFVHGEQRISAEFVEDVLIRHSVASR
jgi:hypothetical protein